MLETIKELREERYSICKECPHLAKLMGGTCRECGCNMIIKTWIPIAVCPKGKW